MNIRRAIAASALLGALFAAGAGATGANAAGATKTYANKAHGYRLHYPAAWTAKPKSLGQDVAFYAPDKNAFVTALAVKGTATTAEIKSQQAKVLRGIGTAQGPLNYAVKSVNGVAYQISEIVTKTNGKILDVILLDTVHGAYLYDFEGFLQMGKPSAKAETKAVQGILNSITLSS
jgi:hypothetical protein